MATPKRLPWALVASVSLALALGLAAESRGQDVTCYCRLALASGADPLTGGLEIRDWEELHVYNTSPLEMLEYQVKNCAARCMQRAQQDPAFSDPAGLCRKVARAFDGRRQAVARIDENPPVRAFFVPLKCCPVAATAGPVSCPAGWTFDANGPGTLKCRRNAGHLAAEPLPPNGTPVGAWGIVLGADVWQWGPPAPAGSGAPAEFRPCS